MSFGTGEWAFLCLLAILLFGIVYIMITGNFQCGLRRNSPAPNLPAHSRNSCGRASSTASPSLQSVSVSKPITHHPSKLPLLPVKSVIAHQSNASVLSCNVSSDANKSSISTSTAGNLSDVSMMTSEH